MPHRVRNTDPSLPDLTRQSILLIESCEGGWMRGSYSAKTRFALKPAHDDGADEGEHCESAIKDSP